MKKYILKTELDGQPVHDGIIPGLGDVRHGVPFTPAYPAQEEQVKADPRFKVYGGVSEDAKVETAVKTDSKKTADSGKDGK